MESNHDNPAKKGFIKNILRFDIGILIVAMLVSWLLNINLGIVLLLLGVLVGGAGTLLAGPDSLDPKNPKNLSFKYYKRPNELASEQISYNAAHLIPRYSFENLMIRAGLIAVAVSALILIFLKL